MQHYWVEKFLKSQSASLNRGENFYHATHKDQTICLPWIKNCNGMFRVHKSNAKLKLGANPAP